MVTIKNVYFSHVSFYFKFVMVILEPKIHSMVRVHIARCCSCALSLLCDSDCVCV